MIWKRTRQSHRGKQDPIEKATKQADLEMLQWSAAVGEIDLFYLDESGFCMWMPVEHSYFFRGEQKRLEQTARKGRRISILGLLQPKRELCLWTGGGQFQRGALHHDDG
ncbi:hypothetical protein LYNGBM3L_74610 [Moorena producens 3L]|uniref:Tc1-like transposase DDE domain-containing protein n=1 Tax=Moorena producens 3L TaxID=489825 RepID=F4Y438_9CYAN|nr:hypothetical protein LYNGBM3L_74610 [Moorena producens 3L]